MDILFIQELWDYTKYRALSRNYYFIFDVSTGIIYLGVSKLKRKQVNKKLNKN
jgi:hypothetical protein